MVVSIRNITKMFADVTAVDNVSLDIERNEFFALLGPSGCGKTTLLRMLAGLERPSSGEIVIDGENMAATPPNKRRSTWFSSPAPCSICGRAECRPTAWWRRTPAAEIGPG